VALVTKIRNKTATFAQLIEMAEKNAQENCIPQHFSMQEETGELKGVVLPLEIDVRTIAGVHKTNYILVCRDEVIRMETEDGHCVEASISHKLLVDEEQDLWVMMKDLQIGTSVRLESGYTKVKTLQSVGTHKVADICVPGPHSYLLDNGLVSHNSLCATQLAINLALRGYKVVIVPLEMSKVEMTSRIIANVSGLDVTQVLQRRLATGEKEKALACYSRFVRLVKKRGGRLTVFKPTEDMDIEEVYAATSSYDADVNIIDYISLLKGADSDDAWQKLGAMARLAKINAEATNRVNVLLCQVSDEGKIRYSRAISEHSTNSWIWTVAKEEREKEIGRVRIEQPKARNSRSFPFEVGFHWAHMKVVDVDSSDGVGDVPEPMKNLADQK
jgi:hypothetical protein